MGRIGREVARPAQPFGMLIHYHNRQRLSRTLEENAIYHPTPEQLLAASDIFIICAPGTPALRAFLNRERIALLPPNAIVVNLSRGDFIDDTALIEALRSRRLFAAGLDVYANEPAINSEYRELQNVFLTPHIGSATEETRNAMGFMILDAVRLFEEGLESPNRLC